MAAKPSVDYGLGNILARRGQGRGVEPAEAVAPEPTQEEALEAIRQASDASSPPALQPVKEASSQVSAAAITAPLQTSPAPLASLPLQRSPSTTALKNLQVRLPESVVEVLQFWSFVERRSQQQIMEEAISASVRAWMEAYQQRGAGG